MLFSASWDSRMHEIKETLLLEVVPWHLVPAVHKPLLAVKPLLAHFWAPELLASGGIWLQ